MDEFFKEYHLVVLLLVGKLNRYLSKHNEILFMTYNYMFRLIPGHRQVQSWSFKHIEGEIHIMSFQGHPTRHIDL